MEWFKLIVELLVGLAWPTAVVLVVLVFRKPLQRIAERATKGRIGSFEWEIPALSPSATPALPPPNTQTPPAELLVQPATEDDERDLLAKFAPGGAVVAAWARLERAAYRSFMRVGPVRAYYEEKRLVHGSESLAALRDLGVLDEDAYQVAVALRRLRNEVAHGMEESADIASSTARDFVEVVDEIERRILTQTDALRLAALLKALQATTPDEVEVGPLAAVGISADPAAAAAAARSLVGKWGAKTESVSIGVSDDDASTLLRHGARYKPGVR